MSIKLLGPIMLAILLIPQQSVQAYEDEDEYRSYVEERSYDESGGRFRAGAMADCLTPESEAIRDNAFGGYYDEEGESAEENGMEEFISPDSEDIEDLREEWQ